MHLDSRGHLHECSRVCLDFAIWQRSIDHPAVIQGLVHAYASSEILLEYAEVLARPKFSFRLVRITALVDLMRDMREIHRREQPSMNLPDPDDNKFLVCARAASAHFIVTGNKRHFPQEICNPIQVVNASELLDRLTFGAS